MNHLHKITLIITLLYWTAVGFAQDEIRPGADVNVDDLGDVSDEFQELFFEALKQKGIENYEKAITALEKCQKLQPLDAVVYYELAKNHTALKNYVKAEKNVKEALELKPKDEDLLVQLYEVYFAQKEYEKAIETTHQLLGFDMKYQEKLANLYMLTREYDKALLALDKIDVAQGQSLYRDSLRTRIYAQSGNILGKIANLEKRIATDPENNTYYIELIEAYKTADMPDKVKEMMRKLEVVRPQDPNVQVVLYKDYIASKQTSKAVYSIKAVISSNEIDPTTKFDALNALITYAETHPEVEPDLKTILEEFVTSGSGEGMDRMLGEFYLTKNDTIKALGFYESAVKQETTNLSLIKKTADLQLKAKRFKEAQELTENTLALYPTQAKLYVLQAKALNGLQEYDEAIDLLMMGLDFVAGNTALSASFFEAFSMAYAGKGDEVKAKEYREKAKNVQNSNE
ncbi:hypothetical protein GCM10009117_19450 [Gangjinia marincola]|uniref:Tetratricopeptide repeat protein n=1 Tax=Gangjinia marincola TaxID=578463 RepID=A0ABN1MI30_9FLAO